MRVLFDAEIGFHYGFAWFDTGVGTVADLSTVRGGQANGLLGAAEPGLLSMVVGMHSGQVPVRIEFHDTAPAVDDDWDDIVEASLDARGPDATLSTFDEFHEVGLPANGWYRARWHDHGADAGQQHERFDPDEPVVERCLLQLWPAPPAPDVVVRETSGIAAYWRSATTPHPPPRAPELRAYDERAAQLDAAAREQRATRAMERQFHLELWGGRDPSPRLLEVQQEAVTLVSAGRRDLVDTLAALEPEQQRTLALALVRAACAAAADAEVDWAPALAAIRTGDPLPPPFDDPRPAYDAAFGRGETTTTVTLVVSVGPPPPRIPLHPASSAVGAVLAAGHVDPLAAVLGTVEAVSWSAPDLDQFFADIQRRVRAEAG